MIPKVDCTDLAKNMLSLADRLALPADHELRTMAGAFNTAVQGFFATPQTVSVREFVGVWARCRKALSQYSGTPLI